MKPDGAYLTVPKVASSNMCLRCCPLEEWSNDLLHHQDVVICMNRPYKIHTYLGQDGN